jgi:hypothetical protein
MPWSGWQPCAPMSPTRVSRWFVTMDITAMSAGAVEKNQTRMDWSPASRSPMNHPGGAARTGQGLPFIRL